MSGCWMYVYIKGFFDNLRHDLLMRVLQRHTDNRWVLLYIGRWLKAPIQNSDGVMINRDHIGPIFTLFLITRGTARK